MAFTGKDFSMNKRLIAKNAFGKTVYCVLSSTEDYKEQIEKVFNIERGRGFSIDLTDTEIKLVDYFHGDTVATFDILSLEDTKEDVLYQWNDVKL